MLIFFSLLPPSHRNLHCERGTRHQLPWHFGKTNVFYMSFQNFTYTCCHQKEHPVLECEWPSPYQVKPRGTLRRWPYLALLSRHRYSLGSEALELVVLTPLSTNKPAWNTQQWATMNMDPKVQPHVYGGVKTLFSFSFHLELEIGRERGEGSKGAMKSNSVCSWIFLAHPSGHSTTI